MLGTVCKGFRAGVLKCLMGYTAPTPLRGAGDPSGATRRGVL